MCGEVQHPRLAFEIMIKDNCSQMATTLVVSLHKVGTALYKQTEMQTAAGVTGLPIYNQDFVIQFDSEVFLL